jgi:hypothetical protein
MSPVSRLPRTGGTRSLAVLPLLFLLAVFLPGRTHATATASTLGEQRTAVILVNFTDNLAQPATPAQAHALVFGQVSDFFWEASYQKVFLSGGTFGWFTLPVTAAACTRDVVIREGNRAASEAGADLSTYPHVIYLFPTASGCTGGGSAQMGARGEKQVFINGAAGFALRPIAHEMGHGFGLSHANALDCSAGVLEGTCTTVNYGDGSDGMGGQGHFNAFHKERLGWLNAPGAPSIATVTSTGRHVIQTYETPDAGVKALKILKSTDSATGRKTWYYLEYRQPIGFDGGLAAYGNLTRGVQVRTGFDFAGDHQSMLLDMTPGSTRFDFDDAALEPGRSYADAAAAVAFSVVSIDADGAVVDVQITGGSPPPATCVRSTPSLSLSGPAAAMAAGSTASYTVTVGNRDSAACAATTFNLARMVPHGWSGVLGASSLSLSPGASAGTTLTVTSPANAPQGDHPMRVDGSSTSGAAHAASGSATYAVAAASPGTLTSAVGTDKATYARGDTVFLSALVRRDGVVLSGAGVRFAIVLPGGASDEVTATSGSDGYARATYRLGKGKTAVGAYQVNGVASSGGASATASAGFNVR